MTKLANIRYPFNNDATVIALDGGAALPTDQAIDTNFTIIDIVEDEMDAARTLGVEPADDLAVGALLVVKAKASGGARVLTFGDNITDGTWTVVQDKTWVGFFFYDGTNFIPWGAVRQID